MDVRCEKCQTEYELDESRLKPGGVTVKCTTCGHMFKIRKRSPTQSGIPVVKAGAGGSGPGRTAGASRPPENAVRASEPAPRPVSRGPEPRAEARTVPERRPEPRPEPRSDARTEPRGAMPSSVPQAISAEANRTGPSVPPPSAEGDRSWIIRLENGESRTCRELGTLQQWIITGLVSRESMISRSGKTWKRLGDIAELQTFFTVADEASHVRAVRNDPGRRHDFDPDEDTRPTGPLPIERRTAIGAAAAPRAPALVASPTAATMVPGVAPRPAASPEPLPPAPAHAAVAALPARARVPTPPPPLPVALTAPPVAPAPGTVPPVGERRTAGWAIEGVPPSLDDDATTAEGPRRGTVKASDSQSFGGVVRPAADDAFTSGLVDRGEATMEFEDDLPPPRRRGAGVWIALSSLIVIGGAFAAVYFLVLRPKAERDRNQTATIDAAAPQVASTIDAGAAVPGPIDASATATSVADLVEQARDQLGRDVAPALIAAGKQLADSGGDAPAAQAMRARLLTAQAQIISDEADFAADAASADKIRRDGKQLVLDALALAQKALKQTPADPDANLAMAEVLRLQGKPAAEVRRYLSAVKGDPTAQREASLASALLDLRDKQTAKAKAALAELDTVPPEDDVRVRWRLAVIAAGAKQPDAARTAAQAVLAAQPDHAGARALMAKVDTVATDDAMPPEVGSGSGSTAGSNPGSGSGSGSSATPPVHTGGGEPGPSAGEGYDRLLAKANKLAEVNCAQAVPYYEKALEEKPNSVEALTGMGYCHLDAKQFSSAHSKFRAALGISPRYERALWGMGELYQQQGRPELAVQAFKDYLEVYPNSVAAQKQLDRLQGKVPGGPTPPESNGGDSSGSGDSGGSGDSSPPTQPEHPTGPAPRPDLPSEPQTTP